MKPRELADWLALGDPPAGIAHQTLAVVEREGYDQLKIQYPGDDGEIIPAFLLQPRSRPVGAILALHQHASQWHLGKSEVVGLAGNSLQAFGPELARRGILVLAPDSVGFEERRPNQTGSERGEGNSDWLQYLNAMAHRLLRGELLMRQVLRDARRATSLLVEMGATRVGVIGHSYGGNTTLFHAASDERVQFACASGAACTFRRKIADGTGIEMSLIVPGFAARWDIDDLVRAIGPRPLLLVSGATDRYSQDADEIERAVRPAWEATGAGDALAHFRDEGGHDMTPLRFEKIVNWTARQAGA